MTNFYTNVSTFKGDILLRGYEDGKRIQRKIKYRPYLFAPSKELHECKYRTVHGKPVARVDFASIGEARDFIKRYKDVANFDIYGMTNWQYTYIYDTYGMNVQFNRDDIRILWLDIETDSQGGFPNIREADKEINAVTLRFRGQNYVFGFREFVTDDPNTHYKKCADEKELLERTVNLINEIDPDIVSGWNSSGFDIPYITNRCVRLLGPERTRDLSPWKIIERREIHIKGKEVEIVTWGGVASLDYIDVYKKFRSATRESYKLDYIANFEIGANKIDYSEYGSLHQLYVQNHQKYIEYNIYDATLLDQIEEKLGLFNILLSLAYFAGTNYLDTFATVRPWDVVAHNKLLKQKIVVPQFEATEHYEGIEGAYVKDPEPGLHKWVVSFDVNSLYPSLARQCNISPETLLTTIPNITVDKLFNRKLPESVRKKLKDEDASLCASGCVFDNSQEGFIPAIMREVYAERVSFNKKAKAAKKKMEAAKAAGEPCAEFEAEWAYYYGQQFARKIFLNAGYGALSNKFYRWFDPRLSESITKTGQLTVRWAERALDEYLNKLCKTVDHKYVLYCDTDSAYVTLDPFVQLVLKDKPLSEIVDKLDQFCEKRLQKVLNEAFKEMYDYLNHREMVLEMKRENIADKAFWTAKKRYAMNVWDSEGVRYEKPESKIQGLEAVKSSVPRVVREQIGQAIQIILNKEEADLQEFIQKAREEFCKRPFEEVATTKTVNGLAKYTHPTTIYQKGCPMHVRAVLMYNHLLKEKGLLNSYQPIEEGDKIKVCYMQMPNPANSSVMAAPVELPKEFELDSFIDYNTQWDKSFMQPLKTMLDVIGWKPEPIPSLDDLFID